MAKYIGILLALCSTLAIASETHFPENSAESQISSDGSHPAQNSVEWPHHGNNNNLNFRHWPGNNWLDHSSRPLSSQNAGEWPSQHGFNSGGSNHGFHSQPYKPLEEPSNSEDGPHQVVLDQEQPNTDAVEKRDYGYANPQSPKNFNELKKNPWLPVYTYNIGREHPGFFQPYAPHGLPQVNNIPIQPILPMFGNQNWVRKVNSPDWYNPHFPQIQANAISDDMSRRRPIFAPLYPYHLYPYGHHHGHHAHPSTDDEEFETIEARSRKTRYYDEDSIEVLDHKHDQNHGSDNTNRNEHSDNDVKVLYHVPHYNPFPNSLDNNDDNFSSNDAQTYEFLPSPGTFIITDNNDDDREHFKIPNILEIIEQWLNEHVKPYHPHHKPEEDEVEGSGDEDIIPLSRETVIALTKENEVDQD